MRFLLMVVIALGLGLGMYYVMMPKDGSGVHQESTNAANDAKAKADAYKKSQEDMMRQLGQ